MRDALTILGMFSIIELDGDHAAPLVGEDLDRALRDGSARITLCQRNLITDIGLSVFSRMIGNNAGGPLVGGSGFDALSDITVGKMELGVTVNPSAPAAGDTTGVGTLAFTPPLTVTYPDAFTTKFSGVLPTGEGNGQTFTEEALKLRNGKVFAKKTFSKAKTSSFAVQFDHAFTFGRA
jgi:hypothetical protein